MFLKQGYILNNPLFINFHLIIHLILTEYLLLDTVLGARDTAANKVIEVIAFMTLIF